MNRIILNSKRIQYVNKNTSLPMSYNIECDIPQRVGSYFQFFSVIKFYRWIACVSFPAGRQYKKYPVHIISKHDTMTMLFWLVNEYAK